MDWLLIFGGLVVLGIVAFVYFTSYTKKPEAADKRIEDLPKEKYSSDMGRFAAGREAGAAASRAKLVDALNTESKNLAEHQEAQNRLDSLRIQQDFQQSDYKRKDTIQDAALIDQLGDLEAKAMLRARADEEGVDLPSYLEIEKKRQFNKADLENELTTMREKVRLAIVAKHFSDHQMISLLGEQLDNLYGQVENIRLSTEIPEAAKRRMIEDREEYIGTLRSDRLGRQQRLLEANNGGDVRGDDEDTDV